MLGSKGVIELPLRLLITLIIGGIALATVLAYMFSPCLFKKNLQVCWDKYKINAGEKAAISVTVLNDKGNPIKGATVLIKGFGNATVDKTDKKGGVTLYIKISKDALGDRNEGYLELVVDAGNCYRKFKEEEAIKVIKVEEVEK